MADDSFLLSNSRVHSLSTSYEFNVRGREEEKLTQFPPYKPNRGLSLSRFRRYSQVERNPRLGDKEIKFQDPTKPGASGSTKVKIRQSVDSVDKSRRRSNLKTHSKGNVKHYKQNSDLISSSNDKNRQRQGLSSKRNDKPLVPSKHQWSMERPQSKTSVQDRLPEEREKNGRSEGRRVMAVNKEVLLKRIKNMQQDTGFDVKGSKSHWVPDQDCNQCSNCNLRFSTFVRRHHCRVCGHIFCSTCSLFVIPGEFLRSKSKGNVRTCQYCFNLYLEFRRSKKRKKNSTHLVDSELSFSEISSSLHTSQFAENDDLDQSRSMMTQFSDKSTSVGWSLEATDISPSFSAVDNNPIMDKGEFTSQSDLHSSSSPPVLSHTQHQQWQGDNDCHEILSSTSAALHDPRFSTSGSESSDSNDENYPEEADTVLKKMYTEHFDALMTQVIKSYGLSLSWLDVLQPIIKEVSQVVQTDIHRDGGMDINKCVRVKKIPCGEKMDSSFMYGVICTKYVTHKRMNREISNPTILLLNCSISFYDSSSAYSHDDHLTSLDKLSLQESKYLQSLVNRIKVINPSIILVQKYVSRLALEKLFKLGVVVAVNVKQSVIDRVEHFTGAKILCSLSDLFLDVPLGKCKKFYTRDIVLGSGIKKTLMYFDGCKPHLGCVITLQGGTSRELKRVKKVTKFGLQLAHNSILESAFIQDESAWLRKVKDKEMNDDMLMDEQYKSSSSTPEIPFYPSLSHPIESHHLLEVARRLKSLEGVFESCDEELEPVAMINDDSNCDTQNSVEPKKTLRSQGNKESSNSAEFTIANNADLLASLGEIEFKDALERQLVSMTPQVKFDVPYLQTSSGYQADVRKYLSRVIYWSVVFAPKPQKVLHSEVARRKDNFNEGVEDLGQPKVSHSQIKSKQRLDSSFMENISHTTHFTSYKSVSEHPLTKSFLLLRASTKEMQAALADFRARAGLVEEDNQFLFKSAKMATDYQLRLQSVFNKYKQLQSEQYGEDDGEVESEKVKMRMNKKRKPKKKWWIREMSDSSENKNSPNSDSLGTFEDNQGREEGIGIVTEEANVSNQTDIPVREDHEYSQDASESNSVNSAVLENLEEDVDHVQSLPMKSDKDISNLLSNNDLYKVYNTKEMQFDQQIQDCLDPRNHQSISVLLGCKLLAGQKLLPCEPLCIMTMEYYGQNDMGLGDFLQRYCFRKTENCSSCNMDMSKHVQHIVHGIWSISIEIRYIPSKDDNIHTWLECLKCHHATPKKLMSDKSLKYSFAKFLELKFYVNSYVTHSHDDDDVECPCSHRLHQDYSQFFMCCNKLAIFRPSSIGILEIMLPPSEVVIRTSSNTYRLDYAKEFEHIERIVEGVFCRIEQKLSKYRLEPIAGMIDDHISNSKRERDAMRSKLNILKELMTAKGLIEAKVKVGVASSIKGVVSGEDSMTSIQDFLAQLKRSITELVECWNIKLEELDNYVRDLRKKMKVGGSGMITEETATVSEPDHKNHQLSESPVTTLPVTSRASASIPMSSSPVKIQAGSLDETTPTSSPSSFSPHNNAGHHSLHISDKIGSDTLINLSDCGEELDGTLSLTSSDHMSPTDIFMTPESLSPALMEEPQDQEEEEDQGVEDGDDGAVCKDLNDDQLHQHTVGDLPDGYLNQQSVISGADDRLSGPDSVPTYKGGSTKLLSKFRKRDQKWRESPSKYYLLASSFPGSGDQSTSNVPANRLRSGVSGVTKRMSRKSVTELQGGRPKEEGLRRKKKSWANITDFITVEESGKTKMAKIKDKERLSMLSRPFQRLPPPLDLNEHHIMPSYADFPIAIYEREPTSIIAYALSMQHCGTELKVHQDKKKTKLTTAAASSELLGTKVTSDFATSSGSESKRPVSGSTSDGNMVDSVTQSGDFSPGEVDSDINSLPVATSPSGHPSIAENAWGKGLENDGADEMDTAAKSTGHIDVEFSNSDKTANFSCKVYFAEEFRQFREKVFPDGEDKFIRSLSRCVTFDAKGGKSRAIFCKVADDRFILKQVHSVEISAFLEFAPRYLGYISKALEENHPIALAKIFGAYSISFKNNKTGKSKKMDVIIMENLLYDRNITKTFDLKGSMRNRYVDPDKSNSGEVLLDENFLKHIGHNPVYLRPHSKFVLMKAISADSEFLAQNSVMDYSLLTGIDKSSCVLTVGIIDYVRTFTLDKRLEMYVKKTASRKELPTVVDPELYRRRFCEAMERYFTVVPDKWSGLGTDF